MVHSVESKVSELGRYQLLLAYTERLADIGSWEYSFEDNLLRCSESLCILLGVDPLEKDQLTPQYFNKIISPEDFDYVEKTVKDSIENLCEFNCQCRVYRADGELRVFQTVGGLVVDPSGKVTNMIGVAKDITKQLIKDIEIRNLTLIAKKTNNAVIISDEKGRITWVNEAFHKITGYRLKEVYHRTSSDVLCGPLSDAEVRGMKERKIIDGEPFHCQLQKYRKDGQTFWVEIEGQPLLNEAGKYTHYFEIETDITEKKSIESEREQLSLIAQSTDNMVIITDEEDRIVWVNNAFIQKIRYTLEEVKQRKPSELLHGPKTIKYKKNSLLKKMKNRQSFSYELLWYSRTGDTLWVEIQGQPIFNDRDEFVSYFRIARDITDKKVYIERLIDSRNKIKRFAHELNRSIEEERSRIARELHDELGQQLSSLRMYLPSMRKTHSKDQLIETVAGDLGKSLEAVKEIATGLRPGILDVMGLIPSLEWLVCETKKKAGIECSFVSKSDDDRFDEEISITFFRICQEALNNAVKHARATKIQVNIVFLNNCLILKIADDGIGSGKEVEKPMCMGLLGMYERAELIEASLQINSDNAGTEIILKKKV